MGKTWPAHESLHRRWPERALSKARHPIDTHTRKKNTQAGDGVVRNLSSRYFWEARGAGSSPFLELISGMPAPLTHLEGAALQLGQAQAGFCRRPRTVSGKNEAVRSNCPAGACPVQVPLPLISGRRGWPEGHRATGTRNLCSPQTCGREKADGFTGSHVPGWVRRGCKCR